MPFTLFSRNGYLLTEVMHGSCNFHPTQIKFWGNYTFCCCCFSELISSKQRLYFLGERNLTAPDGDPSKAGYAPESFSFVMIGSPVGPSATGLQLPQRGIEARATARMPAIWNLMGRVEILLKDQQLILNLCPHPTETYMGLSLAEDRFCSWWGFWQPCFPCPRGAQENENSHLTWLFFRSPWWH